MYLYQDGPPGSLEMVVSAERHNLIFFDTSLKIYSYKLYRNSIVYDKNFL